MKNKIIDARDATKLLHKKHAEALGEHEHEKEECEHQESGINNNIIKTCYYKKNRTRFRRMMTLKDKTYDVRNK